MIDDHAIASSISPRRRGFVLTSLIDVIFLLLIFFMLSSQIAPYSLLTVTRGAASAADGADDAPLADISDAEAPDMVFIVSRESIRAGDKSLPLEELAATLKTVPDPKPRALILTSRSATVQDVVTTLEAFETSAFTQVTVLRSP